MDDLESRLAKFVEEYQLPVNGHVRRSHRNNMTRRKCQRLIANQAGYSSLSLFILQWVLLPVVWQLIKAMAQRLYDKIQER